MTSRSEFVAESGSCRCPGAAGCFAGDRFEDPSILITLGSLGPGEHVCLCIGGKGLA
jgi:hypothetical protein